jgi:hypothetical protein
MTKPKLVRLLAMLAIAFALASLIAQAVAVLQGSEMQGAAFSLSLIMLMGAGSRLRKSEPSSLSKA